MGTYDDESPDAGILEKVGNSIRKIVGSTATGSPPVGRGGRAREQSISATVDAAAGAQEASTLARMREGQSTDSNNQ